MIVPVKCEKAELWLKCSEQLENNAGKALRGFFGNLYRNRHEFHQHDGRELIYRHPLIQYKIIDGMALITGLQEGAYLLKMIPRMDYLELHHQKYAVSEQILKKEVVSFGICADTILYEFETPWLGLNQQNYVKYHFIKDSDGNPNVFLKKIIIGNILSMCKSLRYVADQKIHAFVNLKEIGITEIKEGVNLLAFKGEFESNFAIPDYWGIGKSSSRGYGTVIKRVK